jgi:hypothetical protein
MVASRFTLLVQRLARSLSACCGFTERAAARVGAPTRARRIAPTFCAQLIELEIKLTAKASYLCWEDTLLAAGLTIASAVTTYNGDVNVT